MVEMFKNYPQSEDYVPYNRPRPLPDKKIEIMTGESTIHTFEIPFNVIENTYNFQIIYKLGLKDVLIKSSDLGEVDIKILPSGKSIVSCAISAEESKLFRYTCLNTFVQIKFIMIDRSIKMSEIYKVTIRNSIDTDLEPVPPEPGVISGIGYTED